MPNLKNIPLKARVPGPLVTLSPGPPVPCLPMPNAQCPMPNAQCPMPNAQCPTQILKKIGALDTNRENRYIIGI